MWHHGVYQLVHWDIGLNKTCLGLLVDFEDMVEVTGVDHASLVDFVLPGGVGRTMIQTERRFRLMEGCNALRDGVYGGLMLFHVGAMEKQLDSDSEVFRLFSSDL